MIANPTCGFVPLLEISNKPVTGESTLSTLESFVQYLDSVSYKKLGVKEGVILMTVPSILAEIADSGEKAIKKLAHLTRSAIFAGAGLAESKGDMLTEGGVRLATTHGS